MSKATGNVVSQTHLHRQLANDCIWRPIEHLAQAAHVGKLHDEADPIRVIDDDTKHLNNV